MDYSKVVGLNPKYNTFNLSHDKKLSLKMGEIIPVMALDVLPGDKFTIETSHLTRFLPLIAPVMHNVKVKMRYFFSPNRLVWDNWEDFITGPESPSDTTEPAHPYIRTASAISSLPDYMGVNTSTSNPNVYVDVNALPFAHYQFIYEEYFRDQNLIAENNSWKLTDGQQSNNQRNDLIEIQKVAWQHDRFTSALPFTQKGPEVTLPVLKDVGTGPNGLIPTTFNASSGSPDGIFNILAGGLNTDIGDVKNDGLGQLFSAANNPIKIDNSGSMFINPADLNADAATINQLREAFAIQKWLELNARSGNRYTEHIQAHFGVKPQDARLQRPEEFGGSVSTIQFSEVLQTSQTTQDSELGAMGGHALTASGSPKSSYYAQEHGWIFALMYVVPETNYSQGIPAKFSKVDRYDYYQPLLAHIGEQPVLKKELFATGGAGDDDVFGYLPIFDEYRHELNSVHGLMKQDQANGGLDFWHLGRKFANANAAVLNEDFITCVPDDRIFTVAGQEQIIAHVYNDVYVKRKVPYYGTPLGV